MSSIAHCKLTAVGRVAARSGARRVEICIGRIGVHRERHPIGRRHADERRATHLHVFDGMRRLENIV